MARAPMVEHGHGGVGTSRSEWRAVYGAIVLAAAVLFAFSVRSILSPVLAYALLVTLLSPFVGTRRHLVMLIAATVLFLIWMLVTLGGLLAPFLLALAIAYILDPALDYLQKRRIRRELGIAILALPTLALIAILLIAGIPMIVDQVESLIQQTPEAMRRLAATLERWHARLSTLRIPFLPNPDIIQQLLDPDRLAEMIRQRQERILEGGLSALLGVGRGVGAVLTFLGYAILTPIVLVYLLRDFDKLTAQAVSLIPPPRRDGWVNFFREYDRLLSRFLRGQVLNALIIGVLTWLGLMILGFPYSGLVGVVAGVFNVVPYLGLIVSIIPVIIISLLSGEILISLLKAGIVFAVVQFLDSSVTGPRIVGGSVGLHPVIVILALTVGGFALGFVGLLIAVPIAVLIKLLLAEGMRRYRSSRVFRSGQPAASGEA